MAEAEGSEIVDIEDGDELYRRLAPAHFYPDGTVNTNAFKRGGKPDPAISVDLGRLTTPQTTLAREGEKPGFGVGALVAQIPRDLGFSVRHHPLPENDAHSLIEGENDRRKSKLMAEATAVVIQP